MNHCSVSLWIADLQFVLTVLEALLLDGLVSKMFLNVGLNPPAEIVRNIITFQAYKVNKPLIECTQSQPGGEKGLPCSVYKEPRWKKAFRTSATQV